MKLSDELKAKKEMEEEFVDRILELMVEAEGGDGPSKIMQKRAELHKKISNIMDFVMKEMVYFQEDKEKTRRFINFFEEISNLFDEFIKAEGI